QVEGMQVAAARIQQAAHVCRGPQYPGEILPLDQRERVGIAQPQVRLLFLAQLRHLVPVPGRLEVALLEVALNIEPADPPVDEVETGGAGLPEHARILRSEVLLQPGQGCESPDDLPAVPAAAAPADVAGRQERHGEPPFPELDGSVHPRVAPAEDGHVYLHLPGEGRKGRVPPGRGGVIPPGLQAVPAICLIVLNAHSAAQLAVESPGPRVYSRFMAQPKGQVAATLQEQRRMLLLDATVRAISVHGLSGLTLARVGELAGLTAGTVSFHFASKEALLLATLRYLAEEFEGALDRATAGETDPRRRL